MGSTRTLTTLTVAGVLVASLAVPAVAGPASFTIPEAHRVGPDAFELPVGTATLEVTGLTDASGATLTGVTASVIEQGPVTRAEHASLLIRAMLTAGVVTTDDALPQERVHQIVDALEDVERADPHAASIAFVIDRGIVSSRSRDRYEPDTRVTREQAATFLVRALDGIEPALPAAANGPYYDDIATSPHRNGIEVLAEAGILARGGSFAPSATLTRGAMFSAIERTGSYAQVRQDPGPAAGAWFAAVRNGRATVPFDHLHHGTSAPRGPGLYTYVLLADGIESGAFEVTWTSTGPPAIRITSAPRTRTTSPSADFVFSSGVAGSRFNCRLDGQVWRACTSPQRFGGLAMGSHSFAVRAIDADGAVLGTATHRWTIESPFTDVSGVHATAILQVADTGVAAGYDDGTYRPNHTVTRAQMATFLTRALGLPAAQDHGFSDVSGVHADAIAAVASAGIAAGYEDGTYRPGDTVTRAQMASFLTRAYRLPAARRHGFSDVSGVHADAIAAVASAGIAAGYEDGTYRPARGVTRGQMATFLVGAAAG